MRCGDFRPQTFLVSQCEERWVKSGLGLAQCFSLGRSYQQAPALTGCCLTLAFGPLRKVSHSVGGVPFAGKPFLMSLCGRSPVSLGTTRRSVEGDLHVELLQICEPPAPDMQKAGNVPRSILFPPNLPLSLVHGCCSVTICCIE